MPSLTGYGLRYRAKMAAADSQVYQAWLWQAGYGGATTDVRLTTEAVSGTWGRKGSDVYAPLLGSEVTVQGWKLTTELADLVGAATGDFLLEIRYGATHDDIDADLGTRYWLGSVIGDEYQDSTMGGPCEVDVKAVCGLGLLADVPYYDTVTTPGERIAYTGTETLLEILIRALGKIGYALPVRSAIAWRPSEWTTGEDPLAHLEADNLSFYSEDGRAMSCAAVAEEIARRLGARLCQWQGAWWLVSRELLTGSTYTAHKYTAAGVADGTTTAGTAYDAAGAGVIRTSGTRSFRPAFASVAVQQNHGLVPPLIDEGYFIEIAPEVRYKLLGGRFSVTIPPQFTSGEWTYSGEAYAKEIDPEGTDRVERNGNTRAALRRDFAHAVPSYTHAFEENPATIKAFVSAHTNDGGPHYAERLGNEVAVGQIIAFVGSVTIEQGEYQDEVYMTYFRLTIDGTNYYLRSDGSWGESTDPYEPVQYLTDPGEEAGDKGLSAGVPVPFKFVSQATPAAGQIRLRLYGSSYRIHPGSDPSIEDVEWDDVAVLVADATGETLGATRTEVFIAGQADPAREEIHVTLGEGPAQALPTKLYYDGVAAEDWASARLTTPRTMDVLHAETVLRHQTAPLEARQESYEGLAASPVAPLKVGSAYYPPQQLTLGLFHQRSEGEWVALAWDGASTSTSASASTDPPGTTYTPQSLGGMAVNVAAVAGGGPGSQSIRYGTVTVTDVGGAGAAVTVTPLMAAAGSLEAAVIQLAPHWMATLVRFGIENVTSTSFDVHAQTTAGGSVTFTWWVIDTVQSNLLGEWDFTEARNSHHLLTL
jgi:hypothetical protein